MSSEEKDCIIVDLSGLTFESNEGSSSKEAPSKEGENSAEKANEGTNSTTAVRLTPRAYRGCRLTISTADNCFKASKKNEGSSSDATKESPKPKATPTNTEGSSANTGEASSSSSQPTGYIAPRPSRRIPAIHGRSRGYNNQLHALTLRHERLKREAAEKKKAEETAAADNNKTEKNNQNEAKANADEKTKDNGETNSDEKTQSDGANESSELSNTEDQNNDAEQGRDNTKTQDAGNKYRLDADGSQTGDETESDDDMDYGSGYDSDDSDRVITDLVQARVNMIGMAQMGVANEFVDTDEDDFVARTRQRRAEAVERGIAVTDLFLGFKTITWGWITDRVRAANRPLLDIILQHGEDPRVYDYSYLIDDSAALEANPEKYEAAFAQLDAGLEPIAFTRKRALEDIGDDQMSKKVKTSTYTAENALLEMIDKLGPGDQDIKRILTRRVRDPDNSDQSWKLSVSRMIDAKEDDVRNWIHLNKARISLRIKEIVKSQKSLRGLEQEIETINGLRSSLENIQ